MEFQRMMDECEKGKIDKILVKSISRFSRNTVDLLKTIRYLKMLNVSVYFEEQKIDTLTEEGELMLTIMASVAQAESENISENAKWAIRKSFQKGIPNTRRRTFGYQWVDGIRSVNGGKMTVSSISFMLRNITYTGNTLLQKTFIRDPFSKKKMLNTGELPQYLGMIMRLLLIKKGVGNQWEDL